MRSMLHVFDDQLSRRGKTHMEYVQMQTIAETYLLLYFDLEELAELSDSEIRLLTALIVEETSPESAERATSPIPSVYLDRIRMLLLLPRAQKASVSEIHLSRDS